MSWFDKLMPSRISTEKRKHSVPEGLWVKCAGCSAQLYRAELKRNLHVCPKCNYHLRIGARERLELFLDANSGEEIAANLEPQDPLRFRDSKRYRERLNQAQRETDESDALVVMAGQLKTIPVVAAAFEFRFMGGSMGSVVGERFVRGVSYCLQHRRPVDLFLGERRCAHAGGIVFAAADGEDERRAGVARRCEAALRLGDDRPDHGWSIREPCPARRHQCR